MKSKVDKFGWQHHKMILKLRLSDIQCHIIILKGVLAIPDIGSTGRFLVWTISSLILGTKRSRIAFLSNTFKRLAFIVPNHMESMVNDHTTWKSDLHEPKRHELHGARFSISRDQNWKQKIIALGKAELFQNLPKTFLSVQ